jgi:hypothetical protein
MAVPLLAVASGCGPSACKASLMQAYVCQLRKQGAESNLFYY